MKCVYPITAGCLCARMSRGLNGQDATGDLLVVTKIIQGGGIAATLDASYYKGPGARNGKEREFVAIDARVYPGVGITSKENQSNPQPGDPSPTISTDSRNYLVSDGIPQRKYIVRRLTPLECCRLQGFPDWWVDDVPGSDSQRYKLWGNGIALPCAYDLLNRIAEAMRNEEQEDD